MPPEYGNEDKIQIIIYTTRNKKEVDERDERSTLRERERERERKKERC